ncbi:YscQ/HrcQ family type III secretion apparatus protein [Burkholderia stabilis]|uniref:YscQ/HrcQ family type III secretion apparatus protein n=1 Tax=Burkholderia stabilis TaxID=95485 RepID=A0A4Q2A8N2_9BURK|nr:type III secretion system cytoplasmic ring protein SctQ [Burkholderia stabilis]RXV65762.1 YscQ/HrcQ family type III secretion apparatus protein [Burkholderia stabilis]
MTGGAAWRPPALVANGADLPALPADALAHGLPRLTPAAAQASRILFDARVDALVSHLGGVTGWQLKPAASTADPGAHPAEPGRIVLAHVTGSLSIDVDLARYPALQILAPEVRGAAPAASTGAAHALRQSIASVLLAPLTEVLLATGIGTWRVADVLRTGSAAVARYGGRHAGRMPDPRDVNDDQLAADVSVTFDGYRHDATLQIGPATLALLERRLSSLQASRSHAAPTPAQDALPAQPGAFAAFHPPLRIPGRVTIGARRIAITALEALRPGDVLLRTLPTRIETALGLGDAFRARAAWGTPGLTRLCAAVDIDGSRLVIIEEPVMTDELQHTDDDPPPLADDFHDEPVDIGELDLPVQFELDSVALPLAQLSSLRPGYVIELDTRVTDARIRLVAHGQTIGHGELIAVADRLGVRILRMAHDDGSVQ